MIVIKWTSKLAFEKSFIVRNCSINWWAATTQIGKKQVKETKNLRTIQWKNFTTSNRMQHPACKYIVQTVVGKKLYFQLKSKWTVGWHWTVKQENLDSDHSAVSDLWNLKGPLTLPQYPSFLFSTLVSSRRYGAVLIVGSSMPKSEDWQLSQTRFTVSGLFSYPSEILVSPVSAQDVWQIFALCAAVRVSSQSPFIMFLSAVLTTPTPSVQ